MSSHHPSPGPAPRPLGPAARRLRRNAAAGCLAAALALVGAGCGVRFDTPPPVHPTLTPAQATRQDEAIAAARIAEAARRVAGSTDPALAELLTGIADDADVQREALGGVWVAWPDGAPEGVATPAPSPTADPTVVDPAGVLALLDVDWLRLREAASFAGGALPGETSGGTPDEASSDAAAAPGATPSTSAGDGPVAQASPAPPATGEEALLYASVATSRAAQATALADALGLPAPDHTDPATDPAAGGADAVPRDFPGTDGAQALLVLDAARYGLETAAARSQDPQRATAALAARRALAEVETLAAAGVPDERRAAYPSGDPTAFADPAAMGRASLATLLPLYLTGVEAADPAGRAALVDGAARTAVDLVRLGAAPGELTALPGGVGVD